jgi:hypothetical protein
MIFQDALPTEPTEEWPGGWLIYRPHAKPPIAAVSEITGKIRYGTPAYVGAAWRTEAEARAQAQPDRGEVVAWTPVSNGTPLTAAYWAGTERDGELPVGIVEIAGRLNVKRATVDQWQARELLPDPAWTVGGRPAWPWSAIRAWAHDTGRLP